MNQPPEPSPPQLLESARAGDAQALSELLRRHQESLVAFIARMMPAAMRSQIDAEDVLQDAYFLAFRGIGAFSGDADGFRRWLVTIARNCLIDHVRAHQADKRAGERWMVHADPTGSIVSLLEELAIYRHSPSQSAARHEMVAAIEQALELIPHDYGLALKLRYIQQLSVAQVAEKMETTEGSVYMLCNRGLKALRRRMRSSSLYL